MGRREKVNSNAVTTKASAYLTTSPRASMVLPSYLNLGYRGWS